MSATKQKGDIAEAFVAYLLKQKGFNVLIPWGEDNRYDIVSEKNGIFKRIQIKYITPRNGVLEVNTRSCNNYQILPYSPKDIDIIAVYSPNEEKTYFIPFGRIKNRSVYKLRLEPTKNKQKKHIVMASKYESRFDFLEK